MRHFAIQIEFSPRENVAHLLPRVATQEFNLLADSKESALRTVAARIVAAKIVGEIRTITVKSLRDPRISDQFAAQQAQAQS